MKKFGVLKRTASLCAVMLALLLCLPLNAFAAATYCVNENFNSKTDLAQIINEKLINPFSDADKAGKITLAESKGSKVIKYDKTANINDKAFYTDVFFGSSHPKCPQYSKIVYEVTFWYTGSLNGITVGELVGARKETPKTNGNGFDPKVKTLLGIKNGNLVDGKSNVVTPLSPDTKYTVAIAIDDSARSYSVYLNNASTPKIQNTTYDNIGTYITCIRGLNLTGMKDSDSTVALPDFYMDDIKLYYADKPECAGGTASATSPTTTTPTTPPATDTPTVPEVPTQPSEPTAPDPNESEGTNSLNSLFVKEKEFEFTAEPPKSEKKESDPVKLESVKDIAFIGGTVGAGAITVALTVFLKKKII